MKILKLTLPLLFASAVAHANCIDQIVNYRATGKGTLETAECFHSNKLYSESLPLLTKLAERDSNALEYLLKNLPSGYESVVENFLGRIKPKSLTPKTQGDYIYWRALGLNRKEKFKSVLGFTANFPKDHRRYNEVQFLRGVAYLNQGNTKLAESLFLEAKANVKKMKIKSNKDLMFQDILSSSLGKIYLTGKQYKKAEEQYKEINPQGPIWYENLMELGWNQLASKNYSEALGNMYFVDKNTNPVSWKPDSYLIRSMAFLNLCHFPDANEALKVVEEYYKTLYSEAYEASKKNLNYYDLLKQSLNVKLNSYVSGVPVPLIRYAAIDIDFIQIQESINNLIDEIENQRNLENKIVKRMGQHEDHKMANIDRIAKLREDIVHIKSRKTPNAKKLAEKEQELAEIEKEYKSLNASMASLDKGVKWQVATLEKKIKSLQKLQSKLEVTAAKILKNKVIVTLNNLKKKLDQAELVRFEIYSRSGNNIRYRLAGGKVSGKEKEAIFKAFGSKELKWSYNGEIWQDEYGSLNSSVKDQCDALSREARKQQ